MATGSEADARDAELAALSGDKLVDLLRTTHRRTDFDAAARVLKARDRRFADLKAALSDIDALRKKHGSILGGARRRPRDEAEAEEITPLPGIASRDPVHRDEPRVEDSDDVPLVQRLKRPRLCETGDLESGKRGGQGRSDSAGTLGNYGQKSSPAKSVHHSFGPKERIGKLVASCRPKDSKQRISNLKRKDPKQGRRAVEPAKWGGGMARTAPLPSPGRSLLPKGSSKSDHGRARTDKKQGSSDGILGPPPKWNGKIISTSMVESSSSSANKDTRTAMSLYRQSEDAKGGNPVQQTRMVASPSPTLRIGTISASELRAYCLKQQQTPLASCMGIKTQNFRDSAKGGNGLSREPMDVSSKKKLVGGD
ncbi:uncharacterized protein [Lolium perenne]|uniref:uncharacterized protein n=1 Tax=Lolium perenne TaxID=4522 RepID=UPI003A98D53E